jgi:hypothetical protein
MRLAQDQAFLKAGVLSEGALVRSLLAHGLQIGRAIGWRRLASVAAAGILAAGLAKK